MALKTTFEPQGSTGQETAEWIAYKSHIGDVLPHRKRVPILDFASFTATGLAGIGTGAPALTEVSTFGIPVLGPLSAGDMHSFKWRLPDSVDLGQPIGIEIEWMSTGADAAAAGSVSWIVTYLPIIIGTTAWDDQTTALDTAIDLLDPNAAQYIPKVTSEGLIAGGTIANAATDLLIKVEADAVDTVTPGLVRVWASYYRKQAD